jgi:hypothetical protein
MSEGSIALRIGKDHHPLDRGLVGMIDGVHVATERFKVHAALSDLDIHHIDPMMLISNLLIIVPNGLKGVIILTNLPKFIGFSNEAPTTHAERFIKFFIINLVTNHDYYFI